MTIRRFGLGLGLVALALLAGCGDPAEDAPEGMEGMEGMAGMAMPDSASTEVVMNAAQLELGGVGWEAAINAPTGMSVTVPGSLVPDEDRTSRLGAPAEARVLSVRVRPGDRVAAGQVLVLLQSPAVAMAQSDVTKAEAELASNRAEVAYAGSARTRAERLLALKAIARQEYERAVADDELAKARLSQAEAELRRAVATAQQLGAGEASGEMALRAPSSGVVLSRAASPGAVLEAGAPLITITDPSRLWLVLNVPEQHAPLLNVGGTVSFEVPAHAGVSFQARVEAVGAGLDPETRTLPARAGVNNADGRLRPEMLASVSIEVGSSELGITLPADAVQIVGGAPVVFIAEPDGSGGARFTVRPIEPGARDGDRVTIAQGLASGELVVVRGAFAVKSELEKAAMPEMEMP